MNGHAQHRSTEWLGIFLVLGLLAALLQAGSPGFDLTKGDVWTLAKHFPKSTQQKIERKQKRDRAGKAPEVKRDQAVPINADIPNEMLGLYQQDCTDFWSFCAGIYKIESDHGRSSAPGVHSGVNSFGCCSGPGQFNLRDGTWNLWRPRPNANVYDPKDSVPATNSMLRHFYAMSESDPNFRGNDCGAVVGTNPHMINAIKHYNNSCSYVRSVAQWADTYDKASRPRISFTGEHGCDPKGDWDRGNLAPEVRGFMLKLATQFAYRVSCIRTGHSQYVKGTNRESAHFSGHAFDVDEVDGVRVTPATPREHFGKAALGFGARQVGGPQDLCPELTSSGSPRCFTDGGHQEHWHIQP